MGYKLKDIRIENFKYIEYGKSIYLRFDNYDMTILDGPNGYGKSTLFDAIELLITGTIKHFNKDLLNRGKESLTILANNQNYDVSISSTFCNEDNNDLIIKRVFECQDKFLSKIIISNHNTIESEIDQEQMYKILGINKSLFDIGIYISQSQSLEFLQQKYKDRKEQLTSILDSTEILSKIETIKNFKELFKKKSDSQLSILENEKKDSSDKVIKLTKDIKEINARPEAFLYEKLFEKEFNFDIELINTTKSFEIVIQPLKDLELFLMDYEDYTNTVYNNNLNDIIKKDKKEYFALYFKTAIIEINEKHDKIIKLHKIQKYLSQLETGIYMYDESIFKFLNVETKTCLEVINLLNEKQSAQKQLNSNQKLLNEIIERRTKLLETYHLASDNGVWDKQQCPFCGFESDELALLFQNTTQILKENTDYSNGTLNSINISLSKIFNSDIITPIKLVLNQEQKLINSYNDLNFYTSYSTEKLNEQFNGLKISGFYNKLNIIDLNVFEKDYSTILNKLKQMVRKTEKILHLQQIEKYEMLQTKYYNNIMPNHKVIDLQNKKYYISAQYSNKYNEELVRYTESNKSISIKHSALKQKTDTLNKSISDLCSRYEDAYKQYQSDIANSIRIPLFLFSGKIIQNYPIGLGVLIEVKDNQVVFKADGKDCDIFNILSTGQLNGVILSILLSVKSVFSAQSGLNMLLIDDPLQSIDDISAYSFSDVLSEQFGDTQIIISTHEDDKANLFEFKWRQLGLKSQTYNMQKLYLSS